MLLCSQIAEGAVLIDPPARDKWDLIGGLAGALYRTGSDWPVGFDDLHARILGRERQITTGLEQGVALPHGPMPPGCASRAGFALMRSGIDFASLDGRPAHFVLLLVFPDDDSGRRLQLELLARSVRILTDDRLRSALMTASEPAQLLAALAEAERRIFP